MIGLVICNSWNLATQKVILYISSVILRGIRFQSNKTRLLLFTWNSVSLTNFCHTLSVYSILLLLSNRPLLHLLCHVYPVYCIYSVFVCIGYIQYILSICLINDRQRELKVILNSLTRSFIVLFFFCILPLLSLSFFFFYFFFSLFFLFVFFSFTPPSLLFLFFAFSFVVFHIFPFCFLFIHPLPLLLFLTIFLFVIFSLFVFLSFIPFSFFSICFWPSWLRIRQWGACVRLRVCLKVLLGDPNFFGWVGIYFVYLCVRVYLWI